MRNTRYYITAAGTQALELAREAKLAALRARFTWRVDHGAECCCFECVAARSSAPPHLRCCGRLELVPIGVVPELRVHA